jgi:hypothetical protein
MGKLCGSQIGAEHPCHLSFGSHGIPRCDIPSLNSILNIDIGMALGAIEKDLKT